MFRHVGCETEILTNSTQRVTSQSRLILPFVLRNFSGISKGVLRTTYLERAKTNSGKKAKWPVIVFARLENAHVHASQFDP